MYLRIVRIVHITVVLAILGHLPTCAVLAWLRAVLFNEGTEQCGLPDSIQTGTEGAGGWS